MVVSDDTIIVIVGQTTAVGKDLGTESRRMVFTAKVSNMRSVLYILFLLFYFLI